MSIETFHLHDNAMCLMSKMTLFKREREVRVGCKCENAKKFVFACFFASVPRTFVDYCRCRSIVLAQFD